MAVDIHSSDQRQDMPGTGPGQPVQGLQGLLGQDSQEHCIRRTLKCGIIQIITKNYELTGNRLQATGHELTSRKQRGAGGWARRAQAVRRQAIRGSTSVERGPNHSLRGKVSLDGPLADRGARYSHKVLWLRERRLGAG